MENRAAARGACVGLLSESVTRNIVILTLSTYNEP